MIPKLQRRISRPNGRKAIKRLCAGIETLIDRAPAAYVSTWSMDARSSMRKMRAVLERMYAEDTK